HSEQHGRHTTETTTSLQLPDFLESRPARLHGPSCRMPRRPRSWLLAITAHGGTQSGNGGMWRRTAKSANCSGKFSASYARSHLLFTQISRRSLMAREFTRVELSPHDIELVERGLGLMWEESHRFQAEEYYAKRPAQMRAAADEDGFRKPEED